MKAFHGQNGKQITISGKQMLGVAKGWPRGGQHRETEVAKRWPMW